MARLKEIDEAHYRITEWAEWFVRHVDASSIGYPKQTAEARLKEYGAMPSGQPAKSICPEVMMPRRVSEVDRVIMRMPRPLRVALEYRYVIPAPTESARIALYIRDAGSSRTQYYAHVECGLTWLASGIQHM